MKTKDDINEVAFVQLFKDACEKCFGYPQVVPLTETDSRLLSNKILEHTGLVIGVKSIKNYSLHVLKQQHEGKRENPSVASLDTLARYVLNAPPTDELQRKQKEEHHPYWFEYRNRHVMVNHPSPVTRRQYKIALPALLLGVLLGVVIWFLYNHESLSDFKENFSAVRDSLPANGWTVRNKDELFWEKRDTIPGHLTFYTLRGDNWQGLDGHSKIRNLLVRRIDADCFVAEIHLSGFFPEKNWQQAGILLSEDSTFSKKVVRLSIGYNDFFGGYEKSPEIIIQAVSSSETGNAGKPEEIAHVPVFTFEKGKEDLIRNNMTRLSLRIEKKGQSFRFLYTTSPIESFAFNEVRRGNYNIKPRYIGLFAIQGLSEKETPIPASFDFFSLIGISCNE